MLYHIDAYVYAHRLISGFLMEAKQDAPEILIHCIADVADKYKDRDDAWVIAKRICIASLQDKGYLKPGSMRLTRKGAAAERWHREEEENDEKFDKYVKYYKRYRAYLKKQRQKSKKKA